MSVWLWRLLRLTLSLCLGLGVASGRVAAQADHAAVLTSPVPGETVGGEVEVRGTAAGDGLARYDLHYRPAGVGGEYIYFGGSQTAVEEGSLGTWPGSSLALGDYEIRLTAHYADGESSEAVVRFSLADPEAVDELESAGSVDGPDRDLLDALDRLSSRVAGESLLGYLERGAWLSALAGGLALTYFILKGFLKWLLRRTRDTR